MGRTIKTGLDYFPLDVILDDKFELIEAKHGIKGFGILIKLLQKIYQNNYYYAWAEKEQLLFSKRINVDINELNAVVSDCFNWKIFNKFLYNKYQILTSRGIQKRYFEIVQRRKEIEIIQEYLIIDIKTINVNIKRIDVDINGIDVPKGKERKGKEIYSPTSKEVRLSTLLLNLILDRKPNFKKPDIQKWCVFIDRLLHINKRTPQQIEKVIRWCQQDNFWQGNIHSTSSLRERIDRLEEQMNRQPNKPQQPKKPMARSDREI